MAGVTEQLQARVLLWADEVFRLAVDELCIRLDQEVPRDTGILAESRRVEISSTGGNLTATITYEAPQAEFTETGTDPHRIYGPLQFDWNGLHVIVPAVPLPGGPAFETKDGDLIIGKGYVDHPGSHLHDGWFSQTVLEWPEILQNAADSVS